MAVQTKVRKTVTKQDNKTRGEIESFNRGVWNFMKNQLKMEEAEILKMKIAKCPAKINGVPASLFRFFDPDAVQQKGIKIEDYVSLNEYPEFISFEGYSVKGKGGEVVIKKRNGNETSFLDEKIRRGDISDVGIVIPKSSTQKFLSGFGKFLMMGGFMLILIAVVAIVILISVLMK